MKKCCKFGQVCDGSCTKVENLPITINNLKDKNNNLLQQLASKHDEIKLLQESISKQDAIVEENERLLILNDEYKRYNKKLKKKVKKAKKSWRNNPRLIELRIQKELYKTNLVKSNQGLQAEDFSAAFKVVASKERVNLLEKITQLEIVIDGKNEYIAELEAMTQSDDRFCASNSVNMASVAKLLDSDDVRAEMSFSSLNEDDAGDEFDMGDYVEYQIVTGMKVNAIVIKTVVRDDSKHLVRIAYDETNTVVPASYLTKIPIDEQDAKFGFRSFLKGGELALVFNGKYEGQILSVNSISNTYCGYNFLNHPNGGTLSMKSLRTRRVPVNYGDKTFFFDDTVKVIKKDDGMFGKTGTVTVPLLKSSDYDFYVSFKGGDSYPYKASDLELVVERLPKE